MTARCAIHAAERSSASPALIKAFRALDVQLHDLRSEFLRREAKLRQEYLDRVAQSRRESNNGLQTSWTSY